MASSLLTILRKPEFREDGPYPPWHSPSSQRLGLHYRCQAMPDGASLPVNGSSVSDFEHTDINSRNRASPEPSRTQNGPAQSPKQPVSKFQKYFREVRKGGRAARRYGFIQPLKDALGWSYGDNNLISIRQDW